MPKMPVTEHLPIWAENPVAFEAEPQHIQDAYRDQVEAIRGGAKLTDDGKIKRPRGDSAALPPGYTVEGGRYKTLMDPDGAVLEAADHNGKYDGLEAAADAAWRDYRNR